MIEIIVNTLLLCFSIWMIYQTLTTIWETKRDTKWYEKRLKEWTKDQTENYIPAQIEAALSEYKKETTARVNLLSNENVRLIEENMVLRKKLKNLGFTDTTLDI